MSKNMKRGEGKRREKKCGERRKTLDETGGRRRNVKEHGGRRRGMRRKEKGVVERGEKWRRKEENER